MKIKVNYENQNEAKQPFSMTLDIPDEQLELMMNVDLKERQEKAAEGEIVSQRTPQEILDAEINRPLYNNWHAQSDLNRHRVSLRNQERADGDTIRNNPVEELADIATPKHPKSEFRRNGMAIPDMNIVSRDEAEWERKMEYEETCQIVKIVLKKKPQWAEIVIAVCINGESIRHYARRTGANENNITQKLKRAKEKLKKYFLNRQISLFPKANK